jgi:phenylalanyl-tRNA synthetase alpha chain
MVPFSTLLSTNKLEIAKFFELWYHNFVFFLSTFKPFDWTMEQLTLKIKRIDQAYQQAIEKSTTLEKLELVRIQFLGRKGEIAELMPLLKDLSAEEKRIIGPALNQLKQNAEKTYLLKKETLIEQAFTQKEAEQKYFDVTSYNPGTMTGNLHLYTQATEKIENIFIGMGYSIADGPEVETEFYNFESLNIPKNHPARDMQDTFFLNIPAMVLRTQTSNVQVRTMQEKKPPFAIICTGKVYRNEATDASHDYMFRQFEGLVVGQNISLSNLLATMRLFFEEFFEKNNLKIRARPGYFPFVEPGLEIDMSCPFCINGCSTCKHSCWIELVGGGLVHPNVLKHGSIDPTRYSGFAFGFGLTRLIMLKYRINDIRLLHNGQKEFLEQF